MACSPRLTSTGPRPTSCPSGSGSVNSIPQRLGTGATVNASEGVDRIALKDVTTGKYISAGSAAAGAKLAETATTSDATTQFDAFDWGSGVLTLRSAANGKFVNYEYGGGFVNDQ